MNRTLRAGLLRVLVSWCEKEVTSHGGTKNTERENADDTQ